MLIYESKWVQKDKTENGFYNINQAILNSKKGLCWTETIRQDEEGNIQVRMHKFHCDFDKDLVRFYNIYFNLYTILMALSIIVLSLSIYFGVTSNLFYLFLILLANALFIGSIIFLLITKEIQKELREEMLKSPEYKEIREENNKVFLENTQRKI